MCFAQCAPSYVPCALLVSGRTARAKGGEVAQLQASRSLLALQNKLRGSHQRTRTTSRNSITVQDLSEPVTDPRQRVRAAAGGPSTAWLLGTAAGSGQGPSPGTGPSAQPSAGDAQSGRTASQQRPAGGGFAAPVEEEDGDHALLLSPIMRELFQMYRVQVRGWFEAVRFTRRSLFVILVVFMDQDPISRQVLCRQCPQPTQCTEVAVGGVCGGWGVGWVSCGYRLNNNNNAGCWSQCSVLVARRLVLMPCAAEAAAGAHDGQASMHPLRTTP
jgi:hypothetical protein